jgi:5-oxoprolinase (ATP-hydrolysing) subunit C
MNGAIILHRVGPGVTVQDAGRPGLLAQGLSRGGAADRLALAEGAALLGQGEACGVLELAASLAELEPTRPLRIALTGAPMRALADGVPLAWNASHDLPAGARLVLSGSAGGYSYLHVGGGIAGHPALGAVSAHLAAGIGAMLRPGDRLALGADAGGPVGLRLDPLPRFDGGMLRVVPGVQTGLFSPAMQARFAATVFRKDARGNRMGQRLTPEGAPFGLAAGLTILSDIIVPGDIQIAGDGTPYVLLAECQTTGGYPRIGTVLPCDLPRLVQAPPDAAFRFCFVTLDEAVAAERAEAARRASLGASLRPLRREPRDIPDLLSYQLIDGVTRGDDLDRRTA